MSSSSLLMLLRCTDIAERLVSAARHAGADAADALAVRSVSLGVEVREGAVEESERSEGDDVGLRVLRRAPSSRSVDQRRGRGRGAARAARGCHGARGARGSICRACRSGIVGARHSRSRSARSGSSECGGAGRASPPRRGAALAVKGVTKSGGAAASAGIGGMVLVTSGGFRRRLFSSGQSVSMTAIAGGGTAMERDYDYSSALHAADLDAPEKVGRTAGERTVERLNPRKVETQARAGRIRPSRGGVAARAISPVQSTARPLRARRAFSRTSWAPSCSSPASGSSMIRCAGADCARVHSMPRGSQASQSRLLRMECSHPGSSTAQPAASSDLVTTGHAQRGVSSTPSPGASNLHLAPGPDTPDSLIEDIAEGFYITSLIGDGSQSSNGGLQPWSIRLLDREWQMLLSRQRSHGGWQSARNVPDAVARK